MSNMLSITEKQILRGYCLKICDQAEPLGAGIEVIHSALKKSGVIYEKADVLEACRYLEKKNLIVLQHIENKILGIERFIAHITAKGTDVLEGTLSAEGIELI